MPDGFPLIPPRSPKRGRPAETGALSDAERQKRAREKRQNQIRVWANELNKARKAGDWDEVDRIVLEMILA